MMSISAISERELEAAQALLSLRDCARVETSVMTSTDLETRRAALLLMQLFGNTVTVTTTTTVQKPKPAELPVRKQRPKKVLGDLVPIGSGNALVSARLLKTITWSNHAYTSATRKLLTAVFSRRVLATHSLTGKRSPAFPNKVAKKKLDEALVHDIVQTVVERCGVTANLVRTSITTKCADESKMLRTRLAQNRENWPPSPED